MLTRNGSSTRTTRTAEEGNMTAWSTAAPAISAAFLASLVEVVEAFPIVLAVATLRGGRHNRAQGGTARGARSRLYRDRGGRRARAAGARRPRRSGRLCRGSRRRSNRPPAAVASSGEYPQIRRRRHAVRLRRVLDRRR